MDTPEQDEINRNNDSALRLKKAPKKSKPKKKPAKKRKAVKAKARSVKKKAAAKHNGDARTERLDMRLTKAQKAKIDAKAKKTKRTVTSLVTEAIDKIR